MVSQYSATFVVEGGEFWIVVWRDLVVEAFGSYQRSCTCGDPFGMVAIAFKVLAVEAMRFLDGILVGSELRSR